uniref:Uncharacterized protein n=1 Tax=Chromera velia CCMP2878 TaxID=1169474 RepID=A0A0G4FGT0_9ALVE|eukprot:Cvel_16746.t1-p1 / transcript=Cvel_16746.t1 / gene=Cvel_16746 / organism=Chromera_velia_CCMP2878 / gene_product=hypothetical protein / transcript_product=hypothetical protein / location=Cvel_scaffold1304:23167-27734(-) / protein_length=330 / sequence_SO=supercontig / SO=protein_coding / is_pseudo=false
MLRRSVSRIRGIVPAPANNNVVRCDRPESWRTEIGGHNPATPQAEMLINYHNHARLADKVREPWTQVVLPTMAAGVETSADEHPLLLDGELPRACKVREPSIFAGDRHEVSDWLKDMKEYCQGTGVSESRWLFVSKSYLSKTLKKDALEELQYSKAQGMESFGNAFLDLAEEIKDTSTPADLIHIFKKAIPDVICLKVNKKAPSTLEEAVEAACIAAETLEGKGRNRKKHVQTGGSRPDGKHQAGIQTAGQEGDQVVGEGEEEFWFPDNELSMNIEGEQPTDPYVYDRANMIGTASADRKVKMICFQSTVEGIPVRVLLDCGAGETFLSA